MPPVPGVTGLKAAVDRLRRRRTARLVALGAAVAALVAALVPLALAGIVAGGVAPSEPSHQLPSASNRTSAAHARHRARRRSAPDPLQATLTLAPDAGTTAVPTSFFGISTEYRALPQFERDTPAFERMLSLLHVPGDGPLVLRVGGDSADHSFWYPRWRRMPQWAFELTPRYLARLGELVRRDHMKLIVDLNLLTDTPFTAAAWARAAETSLPHGSIVGFEIGNEPDLYSRRYWLATIASSPFASRTLPLELTPATYVQDFAAYAHVLAVDSPDIPLVGPAVAHPRVSLPFISTLIQDQRPELGMVTGHLYPYSACVKRPRSSSFPTVAKLLSRRATSAFAIDVASAVATAHAAGLKFRLTEFNSVTCGGKPGVSNTFATALWAPDALFTAMRAGVDGANLHVRPNAINAAFSIDQSGLEPRPLAVRTDAVHANARTRGAPGAPAPRRGQVAEPERLGGPDPWPHSARSADRQGQPHGAGGPPCTRHRVGHRAAAARAVAILADRCHAGRPAARPRRQMDRHSPHRDDRPRGPRRLRAHVGPPERGADEHAIGRTAPGGDAAPPGLRTQPSCSRDAARGPRSGPGPLAQALAARRRPRAGTAHRRRPGG